jgi:hypothetical protein
VFWHGGVRCVGLRVSVPFLLYEGRRQVSLFGTESCEGSARHLHTTVLLVAESQFNHDA